MADRFPLILNTSVNQIQEIPSGDQLDLTGNNIANAGIVTASAFHGDGSNLTGVSQVGGNTGVDFNDVVKARFGNGNDLEIYHDSSNRSGMRFTNPEFRLLGDTGSSSITLGQSNSSTELSWGERYAVFNNNGSVDLYYNGTKRIETTNTGATISGDLNVTGVLTYEDVTNIDSVGIITARSGVRVNADGSTSSNYMSVGASDDLKIYHDSNNSYINNTGTGVLYLNGSTVNLQHGGSIKLHTDFSGVGVLGNVDATGLLSGGDGIRLPLTGGVGITTIEKGQASFTGIVTAANFVKADGSSLGGVLSDVQYNTVGGTDVATNRTTNSVQNTLFGYQAGKSIIGSDSNTAIGYRALRDLSNSGNYNVAIGEGSAEQSTNGSYNSFLGNYSGWNVGSEWNVAAGYQALRGNSSPQVTGDKNVAIGGRSLYGVSTGANNIGIGYGSGYGPSGSGQLNEGSNNIIIGYEAIPSNANASNEITLGNTGITTFRMPGIGVTFTNNGTGAQFDGAYNYARTDNSDFIQGANAQARPADGAGWNDNLILGRFAGEKLAAGSSNCLVGFRAGKEMTNGSANTFVGYYAGIDHFGTRTGNTCIGTRAGYYSGQGDHNIIIGHQADVSSNGDSRQIILGKPASVTNFPTDFKIPALNFHLKQTTDTTTGNILTLQSDGSAKFTPFAPSLVNAVGLSTFSGGLNLGGILSEEVNIVVGKLSDNSTIKLEDGMVHYFTVAETTSTSPTFTFSSSVNLATKMAIGEMVSVTVIITPNGAGYSGGVLINGSSSVTTNWVGGNAPTGGGSSGVDIYSYNIIKTGSTAFTVIGNLTKTS